MRRSKEAPVNLITCHPEKRFCDEKSHHLLICLKTGFLASFEMTIVLINRSFSNIKGLFFASIFLFAAANVSYGANLDTSFKFSTIETGHFSIHFHQGLEEIAQRAAVVAEEAHTKITAQFLWTPNEKTQLILIDDSDYTNGYASVLPYNTIYIQTVPPALDMTIGEYDDWLAMIITHEYTHIVTMDSTRGYSRFTRKVFGKPIPGADFLSLTAFLASAPPNVFLPRWWLEGAAVWSETENSGAGRGRSAYYEMIYRMAVAEDNLPTVDKIEGGPPDWPDGHNPYIFGLRMHKHISDRYGLDMPGKLSISHAGRFPYLINGVAQRRIRGKNYVSLYYDMLADLKAEERQQIAILKQVPLTGFSELKLSGETLTNPRWSPDGKVVAYNRQDPHGHEAVWLADKDGSNPRQAFRRRYSDHSLSWSPDGSLIYFTQAEVTNGFNVYSDLYSYNLKTGCTTRLTYGLRVKEADVSPDNRRFAAIVTDRATQNLVIIEHDKESRSIWQRNRYAVTPITAFKETRVSAPRWSPDGARIVYAATDYDSNSSLRVYDEATQNDTAILEGRFDIGYPAWSRDGRFVVFTSDETNVFNLYAYSFEDGRKRQLTHLLGGAFQPDISPDNGEIVFSSYNSRGFKIAKAAFDPAGIKPSPTIQPYWIETPRINPSWNSASTTEIKTINKETSRTISTRLAAEPYSASKTILPRFWLPTLTDDKDGSVLGAFTIGQDALAYNTYLIEASVGLYSGEGYYNLVYHNDYAYPTFTLRSHSQPVLYTDLAGKGDYYERQTSLSLAATVPLNRLENYHNLTLGYQLLRQDAQSAISNGAFGGLTVFEGRRDNLFIELEFSNSLKYPYSISHEEGKQASVAYRYYSRAFGSETHSKEFTASLSEYLAPPFTGALRHSVIYLNLKGGAASGDRITQQAFQLGGTPGESAFPLRGYSSRSFLGKFAATSTLELRSPLIYLFQGANTKPFFAEGLHTAVFMDAGTVWDDDTGFALPRTKVGTGLELRMDMKLGYLIEITPAIGVARGLNNGGTTQVYFTIYANL